MGMTPFSLSSHDDKDAVPGPVAQNIDRNNRINDKTGNFSRYTVG